MICGIDEAGRGPVIGPLVVAGVLLDDQRVLEGRGIRDSKRLSPSRRFELYDYIVDSAEHFCVKVSAEDIDDLRSTNSLNYIEASLFASVIEELCPERTKVFVDAADVDEENFARNVKSHLTKPIDLVSKHGADDIFPVVSAASILAKVERDKEVKRIAQELNCDLGSGYPSDKKTIAFLNKWTEERGTLPKYTRKSWKTAKNILNSLKNRKLEEF